MRKELFISWRYLATKRKEKFISLISVISVLGVAIGVAALIVVIAVMSGFDQDLRDKIVGNYSHITVNSLQGISQVEFENIIGKLKDNPHLRGASPYVQGQVLLKEDKKFFAVGLRGVDPAQEDKVTKIGKYLVAGELISLGPSEVIVGKELAAYLGLGMNTELNLYSPLGKQFKLKVAGIFNSGMYDYDLNLIFTDLATSQQILGMNGLYSAVALKLDNLFLADKLVPEFSRQLGFRYILKSWQDANQSFFAALRLEKLVMFVILTLIILVASFNIISTLVVMVVEKTKDIGILRSLGMSASEIRRIFTIEGMIIGLAGIFFGAVGGIGLCLLLQKYQFIKLPQDIYYIDRLPVLIDIKDVALVLLAALLITVVSTIYPAAKAAKFKLVDALRYE
ncbi:MAG: ABC transporter permease [Candidatus Omnitrophica bacterium]|nr:ABC transporter permease [Candidatus Omnitrophota bacterium]MDD5246547.1 ABC transporter permease [Candidatus Omnitrophota bacterium]MDD5512214.1 ABC transporter permease [Candidatus Omnitrophota bacterium]